MENQFKICKTCGCEKHISEFYLDKRKKNTYRATCKLCYNTQNKERIEKDKNKRKITVKKYYDKTKNIIRINDISTKICSKCGEELDISFFNKTNLHLDGYRSSCKLCDNKYYNKRYREDPLFLLKNRMRYLVRRCLHAKTNTTSKTLGYSPSELKKHLEAKFVDGMSWENYGKWHIDHIKPFSFFPQNTPPNIINALSNLQPLWGPENIKKSNNF